MSATGRGRRCRHHAGVVALGRARRAVRAATASVVVTVSVLAPAAVEVPMASAQAPVPPVTTPAAPVPAPAAPVVGYHPSARIRVLLARLEVLDARARLGAQRREATAVQDDEASARAAFATAGAGEASARRELATAQDRLGDSAAFAYTQVSGGDVVPVLGGDFDGIAQEQQLFGAALTHHHDEVVDGEAALALATAAVDEARLVLAEAEEATADQDRLLALARREVDDARAELREASTALRLTPSRSGWQLTIEGPSAFTAAELVRWYATQGQGSQASVPLAELARLFVEEGRAEGIRGDMAFAQAIHETGWFANRDTVLRNNFAGIGHCSACGAGFPFATAQQGVLAQIQLLKSYAQAEPTYNRPRVDPDLNGPVGCCRTWNALTGVWASDPGYGPSILGRYAAMLEWLVIERTVAGTAAPG